MNAVFFNFVFYSFFSSLYTYKWNSCMCAINYNWQHGQCKNTVTKNISFILKNKTCLDFYTVLGIYTLIDSIARFVSVIAVTCHCTMFNMVTLTYEQFNS